MPDLSDFWGDNDGDFDVPTKPNAGVAPAFDEVAAPCYQCYRTDATEFKQSSVTDSLEVRCTRCNVEYRFSLPGLWRMLGIS